MLTCAESKRTPLVATYEEMTSSNLILCKTFPLPKWYEYLNIKQFSGLQVVFVAARRTASCAQNALANHCNITKTTSLVIGEVGARVLRHLLALDNGADLTKKRHAVFHIKAVVA